jgi:hypothetical protein
MKTLNFRRCLCCEKPARVNRRKCYRCIQAQWRERHPLRAMYNKVKWSAALRDVPFKLTFEEFCDFDAATDYTARRTLAGEDITIDRKDETKGYEKDNLQVLTRGENSRKSNQFRAFLARKRNLRKPRVA